MKIFLSYAAEDQRVADEIQLALTASGHEVFFDKDSLPPAGDYNARIRNAIAESDAMIFLVSPRSIEKGSYTRTELKLAREKWRHPRECVLPVMVSPTDWQAIPPFLKAATFLEPEGNRAAEVAAEVAKQSIGGYRVDIPRTLSRVGHGLQEDLQGVQAGDRSRRSVMVRYFKGIAQCLERVRTALARGQTPHGECQRIEDYGKLLPETVAGFIGEDRAEDYASLLISAHDVEMLIAVMHEEGRKAMLPELEKAQASFAALADSVEAGLGA